MIQQNHSPPECIGERTVRLPNVNHISPPPLIKESRDHIPSEKLH